MADDRDDELERLRARVAELEAALARDKAIFEAVFANIPASFYVKDLDNRYLYGSPHGFAWFGVDGTKAIGKTDPEVFPPELAKRFIASDRRVLEQKSIEALSYAVPTVAGPRHFAGVRFVIPGADGEPIGICGFSIDVTERIELAEQLEKLATTDALTGLANRRRFDDHLATEVARAARNGEPLSLVLCDVDNFKRYNDLYGHPRGDGCLIAVARVLDGLVRRPADLAARYGGEEFAIVLPNTNEEGAALVATRLREAVRELKMDHDGNEGRGVVTVSAGVATVIGAWTSAEVIALADRALYEAKAGGRDRHVASYEEHAPASVGRNSRPPPP
jgi:diguanylate cyclase (GGDEF)-like protein/PAS domain S-box-containing protein